MNHFRTESFWFGLSSGLVIGITIARIVLAYADKAAAESMTGPVVPWQEIPADGKPHNARCAWVFSNGTTVEWPAREDADGSVHCQSVEAREP